MAQLNRDVVLNGVIMHALDEDGNPNDHDLSDDELAGLEARGLLSGGRTSEVVAAESVFEADHPDVPPGVIAPRDATLAGENDRGRFVRRRIPGAVQQFPAGPEADGGPAPDDGGGRGPRARARDRAREGAATE